MDLGGDSGEGGLEGVVKKIIIISTYIYIHI